MKLLKSITPLLAAALLLLGGCGGGYSAKPSPPSQQPYVVAVISSLSPSNAVAGGPGFQLVVTGQHFKAQYPDETYAVYFGSQKLETRYVSDTELTASVTAADIATAGTVNVYAGSADFNSNAVNFSIATPAPGVPSISSISPTTATAGSPDLTVTMTGSNFVGASHNIRRAVWGSNGTNTILATTFVSGTQLAAVVPATLLSAVVTAQVFIEYGDLMGDVPLSKSNSVAFTVTVAAAATAAVSPALVTLGPKGTQQFVATIAGNSADATWEVEEGAAGGSITATGLYTVPAHAGTFHVIATFVADPSKNAAATVSAVASGFAETGSMSTPRSGHTATLLENGKVLILGGGDTSAELFDPTSGTFTPTGSTTTPRYGATATLLANGKVLLTGGFGPGTSSLTRLNSAELYDPSTGTFSATGSMADARILHTATLLNDGKVLITGGTRDGGGGGAAIASAELYDPPTGTFSPTGSMNTDRAQHTATLLTNGEVLIAGGWNGHRADAADDPPWDPLFAELFNPSSGKFKYSGSMSSTRIGHTATRLADGKVLLLGGIPNVQNIHSQPPAPRYAEIYDPANDNFSGLDNLTMSRQRYTVTLLRSGEVLLAGGKILDLVVTTTELLNPTTGALSATGGLGTERVGHTATLLNDGRVLITGGTDAKGNALASAELYQ
jgi:hypothetical protein